MNTSLLIEQLEAYAKYSRPPLHSFLMMYRGANVVECGWLGYSATSYQPVFSVTKSIVSALIGLVISDGKLALSDTLSQWFPELPAGSETGLITVQNLLTMTTGFAPLKKKLSGSDPTAALLNRPLATPPGVQFRYDNEALDLLIEIIARAVGEATIGYAYDRLFAPLGIWQDILKTRRKRLWKTNKKGSIKGGYGLHLTPREMAVFGQLYLQGGQWQGQQIIPADYVAASTTAQTLGGYPESLRYGYLWWISSDSDGRTTFFAGGHGGQYIYIVPALGLVVVCTSTTKNADGRSHRVMLARMATQFILGQQQT